MVRHGYIQTETFQQYPMSSRNSLVLTCPDASGVERRALTLGGRASPLWQWGHHHGTGNKWDICEPDVYIIYFNHQAEFCDQWARRHLGPCWNHFGAMFFQVDQPANMRFSQPQSRTLMLKKRWMWRSLHHHISIRPLGSTSGFSIEATVTESPWDVLRCAEEWYSNERTQSHVRFPTVEDGICVISFQNYDRTMMVLLGFRKSSVFFGFACPRSSVTLASWKVVLSWRYVTCC